MEDDILRKSKPKKARRIRSFNLDDTAIVKMEKMAQEDGLNRSEWVNRMIHTEDAGRRLTEDLKSGVQTTLEIHTHDADHRAQRKDGKCNPKSMNGTCGVCWPNA